MAGLVADASFIIALLNPSDAHHTWAQSVFSLHEREEIRTTTINLAEAMVRPYQTGQAVEFEEALAELEIHVWDVREGDESELAELRASSRLKMPDALVFLCAIRTASSVATADRALALTVRQSGLKAYYPQ
ncbi:MAG: PIN domain-containing protein [Actinomycetales bacterium]|nr:PIN domain-containing protein [Actinomycetales bacterium]